MCKYLPFGSGFGLPELNWAGGDSKGETRMFWFGGEWARGGGLWWIKCWNWCGNWAGGVGGITWKTN